MYELIEKIVNPLNKRQYEPHEVVKMALITRLGLDLLDGLKRDKLESLIKNELLRLLDWRSILMREIQALDNLHTAKNPEINHYLMTYRACCNYNEADLEELSVEAKSIAHRVDRGDINDLSCADIEAVKEFLRHLSEQLPQVTCESIYKRLRGSLEAVSFPRTTVYLVNTPWLPIIKEFGGTTMIFENLPLWICLPGNNSLEHNEVIKELTKALNNRLIKKNENRNQ